LNDAKKAEVKKKVEADLAKWKQKHKTQKAQRKIQSEEKSMKPVNAMIEYLDARDKRRQEQEAKRIEDEATAREQGNALTQSLINAITENTQSLIRTIGEVLKE
jgi:hypothetical protein